MWWAGIGWTKPRILGFLQPAHPTIYSLFTFHFSLFTFHLLLITYYLLLITYPRWAGIGWTEAKNTRVCTTCPPYYLLLSTHFSLFTFHLLLITYYLLLNVLIDSRSQTEPILPDSRWMFFSVNC